MNRELVLRLTGKQYAELARHLLPGDGLEAGASILWGRRDGSERLCLVARHVHPIPYEVCGRRPDQFRWPTDWFVPVLEKAVRYNLSVVKVHSHPGGYATFSIQDDNSDRELFDSLQGWFDTPFPHGSAILLPDGNVRARIFDGVHGFHTARCMAIVGDDLHFKYSEDLAFSQAEFSLRHAQLFGTGTIARLKRLAVAVVGCSGTGNLVVMQLARLGVGRLVLVDPDRIEEKNLGRILPATMSDARCRRLKVDVMRRWLDESGLETQFETFAS